MLFVLDSRDSGRQISVNEATLIYKASSRIACWPASLTNLSSLMLLRDPLSNLKVEGLEIKRLSSEELLTSNYTCRDSVSKSQHPHGGLQPSAIPFPEDLILSSVGTRHVRNVQTFKQAKYSYMQNKKIIKSQGEKWLRNTLWMCETHSVLHMHVHMYISTPYTHRTHMT